MKAAVKGLMILIIVLTQMNSAKAQEESGYDFEMTVDLPATSVKDQHKSGTCWSFCTISFLESELLRTGKDTFDLSDMWAVRHSYNGKARKFVRMHGKINFGGGGAMNDVTDTWQSYGIVPEQAYAGLEIGEEKHIHAEMDNVLLNYVETIVENKNKKLSPVWLDGYNRLLDTYLGEKPETFIFEGNEYTPESFSEMLELDMKDYVLISSFTHHDFYKPFILEVPDNWSMEEVYNVKLDELIDIMDYSLEQGYTIGWASDVSEKGFSWRNGIAVVPDVDLKDLEGTERSKWENLTENEKKDQMFSFNKPIPERNITQELRQKAFDNYQTTDDHGMHITGMAKDQQGNQYYYVKNSWGTDNAYDGYLYASEAFVKYKTISILVHKNAIPKKILKKLGLE